MRHVRVSALVLAAALVLSFDLAPRQVFAAPVQDTLTAVKTARLKQEAASHAAMWRAPKHPGYRTDTPPVLQPTGVVESGLAPLPGSIYEIKNQWHAVENGQLVSAYAGWIRATRQPVVVTLTRSLDYHRVSPVEVHQVAATGPVSILGFVDGQLVLRDATGARVSVRAPHARALLPAPR